MTVGTSAALTNHPVLEATVRGGDQAAPARSANRSVKLASFCSIQLRIRPRSESVRCGCEVTPVTGSGSGSSSTDHVDGGGAAAGAVVAAGDSPPRHDEVRRAAATSPQLNDRRIDSPVKRAYLRFGCNTHRST